MQRDKWSATWGETNASMGRWTDEWTDKAEVMGPSGSARVQKTAKRNVCSKRCSSLWVAG